MQFAPRGKPSLRKTDLPYFNLTKIWQRVWKAEAGLRRHERDSDVGTHGYAARFACIRVKSGWNIN